MRVYKWEIVYGYCNEGGEVGGMSVIGDKPFVSLADAVIAATQEFDNVCSGMTDGRGPMIVEVTYTDHNDNKFGACFSYYGNWSAHVTQLCLNHFNGVDNCDDWGAL